MTKARAIITGALTFHLNRLSPGEPLDADTAQRCLDALNDVVDEWNGQKGFLFREVLTSGVVTGPSGTVGATWSGISPGDLIEGATIRYSGGDDQHLDMMTLAAYASLPDKATAGLPQAYAHDGFAQVFFWPAATGQTVTLRTRQAVSDFADIDTDYAMPKGYQAALSVLVAEKMAPTMAPELLKVVTIKAGAARRRILAQTVSPAITQPCGPMGNIYTGWR